MELLNLLADIIGSALDPVLLLLCFCNGFFTKKQSHVWENGAMLGCVYGVINLLLLPLLCSFLTINSLGGLVLTRTLACMLISFLFWAFINAIRKPQDEEATSPSDSEKSL
jgi:hypothetical protein